MRSITSNGVGAWIDKHANIMHRRRRRRHCCGRRRPHIKGIKYVIFPNNIMIQMWDCIMILSIWYCAFFIPFRIGISGGYYTVYSDGFSIFNIIVNTTFLVDTILAFFRAYRDEDGRMVCNLRTIRWRYIRSGWFFINLLASLPGSNVFHREAQRLLKEGKVDVLNSKKLRLFFIFDLFKLLRLPRIKPLMASSEFVLRSWEQMNVEVALTVKFIFMITVVSHWIACTWGFIAYMEAGSFDSSMLDDINWISNWYKTSYVEGGLNPIGWRNALPRYWLCLFWAIQSITSIGYGTIAPVTNAEYICANILMLLCGIFWANVIGNLVEVVTSMGSINREYSTRMQEANQMMRDFTAKDLPESMSNGTSKKRIRRFLTDQQHAARRNNNLLSNNACAFHDAYPTLSILSPELERLSALHLAHPLLETIPYLSSKYLSPEEQANVALKCVTMEFSALERFVKHPDLGRGLLIFRRGYGIASRFPVSTIERCLSYEDLIGHCLDVNEVLVDNDHCSEHLLVYHFVGYTKVLFVPRTVIMSVLETNKRAWKECARWRYFMASFILYSLDYAKKRTEDYQC